MHFKIYFSLLIFLFIYCGTETDVGTFEQPTPLTDVLTLEMTIGSEKLPDKYLLVHPSEVCVNNDGDIYIADEKKIKVFDYSGKPKTILGGPGQGPGEFGPESVSFSFTISPQGYITEMHKQMINIFYNIFRQDHSLMESRASFDNPLFNKYREELKKGWTSFTTLIALDESHFVYSTYGPIDGSRRYTLDYVKPEDDITVASHKIEWGRTIVPDVSFFFWELLSDEKLVYTCSETDVVMNDNNAEYILNLFSLETGRTSKMSHFFIPGEYPEAYKEEILNRFKDEAERMRLPVDERTPAAKETLKKTRFKAPISGLLTDGVYIFVFRTTKNKSGEIMTDVFDSNRGKYIVSAYFPFIPSYIKNEHAYMIDSPANEFPTVKKYKINPAVYGK